MAPHLPIRIFDRKTISSQLNEINRWLNKTSIQIFPISTIKALLNALKTTNTNEMATLKKQIANLEQANLEHRLALDRILHLQLSKDPLINSKNLNAALKIAEDTLGPLEFDYLRNKDNAPTDAEDNTTPSTNMDNPLF